MNKLFRDMAIFWVIIAVLFLIVSFCQAKDDKKQGLDLTIEMGYTFFKTDRLDNGQNIKAKAGYGGFYIFGGYDWTYMRSFGQKAGDLSFYSIGIGANQKISKYVGVFIDMGVYLPQSELADNISKFTWNDGGQKTCEPLYYRTQEMIRDKWVQPQWREVFGGEHHYSIGTGYGATMGMNIEVPVYKSLILNASGGYRFLQFPERLKVYAKPGRGYDGMHLDMKDRLDASGGIINLAVAYRW